MNLKISFQLSKCDLGGKNNFDAKTQLCNIGATTIVFNIGVKQEFEIIMSKCDIP